MFVPLNTNDAIDIAIYISQFGRNGYLSCDFNGDGDVNAQDVLIIALNFGYTASFPTLMQIPVNPKVKINPSVETKLKNKLTRDFKKHIK